MIPFTLAQKVQVIKSYYSSGESIRHVLETIETEFGIKSTHQNVKTIFQVNQLPRPVIS